MGLIVQNLYIVGGRGKFRKAIRADLQPHIDGNITEFVRWLGKGSKADHHILSACAAAAAECARLIEIAEKRRDRRYDLLDDERIANLVASARHGLLEEDETDRTDLEGDEVFEGVRRQLEAVPGAIVNDDPDRLWGKRQETTEALLSLYRHFFSRGRFPDVMDEDLWDLCVSRGLHVDVTSPDFRRLQRAYLAMAIEVAELKLKRQQGEVIPTPPPPRELTPEAASLVDDAPTLRQIAEKKLAMKQKGYSTTEATETALRLFESVYGRERSMVSITRKEVAEWIFLLQQRPARLRAEDRALGLRELVEAYSSQPDVKRITGKSVNGHVNHLNSVWTWARRRGHVDRSIDNPFSEQRVDEVAPAPNDGFTPAQLQSIFKLPIFSAGERPTRGRGEAAFWLPLLLLAYGTRPEEMCQLLVDDVFEDEGVWSIRITDQGVHPAKGSRSIKGDGNPLIRRNLPVSRMLLDLGFLNYVEHVRSSGEAALFPLLTVKGKRGYLHASFADWWGRYLRAHGAIPEQGNKPLRGFRSAWTSAASRSGLPEEAREWIQGHYVTKGKTSNRKYGTRELGRRVDDVNFKGVDLSGILAPVYPRTLS